MTTLLCTFLVGDLFLGVPIAQVKEVLRRQELTPVPGASESVRGLMNLRGHIVAALDLGRTLGRAARRDTAELMSVVTRTRDGELSLLVDEIGDVIEASEPFAAPPETISPAIREVVRGVHELPERLLLVLDVDHVGRRALGERASPAPPGDRP